MDQSLTTLNGQQINPITGEVGTWEDDENGIVPFSSPIMSAIMAGQVPGFMKVLLDKHAENPELAEAEYSMFAGVEAVSLKEQLSKTGPFEVNILGCAILPHDAYTGMDGEQHEGYWQSLILTDKIDPDTHKNVVFSSSSAGLAKHIAFANLANGWYLWKRPVKYRLSASSKKGAHLMENLDRSLPQLRIKEHKG